MQEAQDVYYTTRYNPQYGVQGFYDTLMDHAQNMLVYPDSYNLMDMFLHGIRETMHMEMFKNGLTPEANTVDNFIAEGKAIEEAMKTQGHYRQQVVAPVTWAMNMGATPPRENWPRRVCVSALRSGLVQFFHPFRRELGPDQFYIFHKGIKN